MTAKKKKAAIAPAPYDSQQPGERKFLVDTYQQTIALLDRVEDKDRRAALTTKLKAIRTKFNALPKNKVTKERVARYVEEVVKVGREIMGS